MLRETMLDIFENIWPMMIIFSVILSSIRIVYLYQNKKPFIFYKEALSLIFILYIMCLFYVVTFQDVSWSSSNFIPFNEMFRYDIGTKLFFKNVIGNMLIFLPYGLFISYIIKTKRLSFILILILIASTTIETTQLLIGRVFDIDDIILNVLGGLFGYLSYYFLIIINGILPKFLKKDLFYNILFLIIIITTVLYFGKVFNLGV